MSQHQKSIDMSKKKGGWVETILTVVYAIAIAFGIRTVAFEPFNIPSGSMIPTLLVGDYLFVSKFSYGYSSQTIAFGLPLFSGRILGSPPARGDVAVFRKPSDTSVDYVKRVIGLHALRNALIPVVTVIGLQVGTLLGGAILTERVFAWPGVGSWLVEAINRRDYPALQGGVLLVATLVIVVNLLVDLAYGLLDPRIRHVK